ncbi:LOW QUALITY PROTEIN: ATP-dependent DNA helicase PIF1-like [Stegodyphus dumicola]|uniref:LOW QUALITY PROTEIN: ATP-dependent DNA helicase PIF1-like n=1 Tax=Stegodyphus dumicola TaxID=202533 RepID=UPI0015AA0FD0|nr:LOW QUALITY PROTEIN: ATP-dependent DNA helicase PIF1-like [Stegodyphus dumicola]
MREETRKKYAEMYAHLRVIIIDEISMLGLKLLSRLDRRLREIRGVKNKRYGNLHVIKFGDLRQLPPVKDAYMFSSDLWWCSNTQFYELDEIMRQKNEKEYLELLDDLANGPLQPEHVQFLASRERPFECLPRESVILCYSNKEVDDYNAKRLSMLPSQMIQCNAYDTVLSDKPKIITSRLNKLLRLKRHETANLEWTLDLKPGARYMLTCTIDMSDGLINGIVGILQYIEMEPEDQSVRRVWIQFTTDTVGFKLRNKFRQYTEKRIFLSNGHPLTAFRNILIKPRLAKCRFFVAKPIIVAEAMTIHKSQGATLKTVAVSLKTSMSRFHQYVAFSRVTKPTDLYILDQYKPPALPKPNDCILKELNRLRASDNIIVPRFEFLHNAYKPLNLLQIMYLHNGEGDVSSDPCFMKSDVLLFTRKAFESIPGFMSLANGHVYLRCEKNNQQCYSKYEINGCVETISMYIPKMNVLFILIDVRPAATDTDMIEAFNMVMLQNNIQSNRTILVGHFKTMEYLRSFLSYATHHHLCMQTNAVEFTNTGGLTTEAIFTNCPEHTECAGVYESTNNYYLPLYIRFFI